MSGGTTSRRIASMDQFRGYTVAGMFLVNFLGGYAAIHPVLKHNNNYFSYADSIMPSFMFAVGFSFRLTYLRRRSQSSWLSTVWTYVRRSIVLIVLSLVMYGVGTEFKSWNDFDRMPAEFDSFRAKPPQTKVDEPASSTEQKTDSTSARSQPPKTGQATLDEIRDDIQRAVERKAAWGSLSHTRKTLVHWQIFAGKLLKSDLWETLAIIGVTQLVVLPFIGCSFLTRFLAMIGLGVVHCLLSYWFNWDFVYAVNDTWLSKLLMTGDSRSWDGGLFGPLSWGVAMMAGTLAYDLVMLSGSSAAASGRLFAWGAVLMVIGYAMSCLTRLYELTPPEMAARKQQIVRIQAEKDALEKLIKAETEKRKSTKKGPAADRIDATIAVLQDKKRAFPSLEIAESPVWPPWERLKGRRLSELIVEAPFRAPPQDDPKVDAPPHIEHRPWNYWMMGKRMPSLSFITFATGFAFALYALFVVVCDAGGLSLGIFTTFGTNALAAYFLHHFIEEAVHPLVPHDAPLLYCLAGLGFFFVLTYLFVRFLEKRKIYIKL
jgi:predicted acyltransferase